MFAILGALLVGGALLLPLLRGNPSEGLEVNVTGCEVGASRRVGTVNFAIHNTSDRTRSARVYIEYRDASGTRLDTDTAYVRDIAPGDTAARSESTMLDASGTGIRCLITGVR